MLVRPFFLAQPAAPSAFGPHVVLEDERVAEPVVGPARAPRTAVLTTATGAELTTPRAVPRHEVRAVG